MFVNGGIIKRSISPIYFSQYQKFKTTGFFKKLHDAQLLIPHEEIASSVDEIILEPEQIPFFTYPYEWSFNQYKEAALLTLKIQKFSLEHGFSLKDASAFNVTFHKGKMIFIDTLSFDFYKNDEPWRAYKQFISHFFAPLLLAKYHGHEMLKFTQSFIDGIPIKMAASMLPFKTKLNPFLYSNIHLLAKFEDKHNEDYEDSSRKATLSKKAQFNLIEGLYDYIKKMTLKVDSEWGNYYDKINYNEKAFQQKSSIIDTWIKTLNIKTLIDIGGNDGTFVRKISQHINQALVCDIDNNAVDANHRIIKVNKETYMLPFVFDVLNPSAAIGFNNKERDSFIKRIKQFSPDVTMALAVIHHMSLSGNVPFSMSAQFFSAFSKYLIIEFPKREDSWVKRLLKTKGDFKVHFDFYNIEEFETSYLQYFSLVEKIPIDQSERVMYLLKSNTFES